MIHENVDKEKHIAVLVGMNHTGRNYEIDIEASMIELEELAEAAGVEVVATAIQNRAAVNAVFYIGKGKVEEIKSLCEAEGANLVVFNDELSGSQIRNLEEVFGIDVIDRTALILDIFALRASSKEAKLQVELAQLKYRLPRLSGLGRKLSRLGAGIGTRGPGETKLETDRRHILRRIDNIREELEEAKKHREVQRSKRLKSELPIIALVGYTNAGKSTLMNTLLQSSENYEKEREVYAEDMLFATLDVSLRKLVYPEQLEFLLTDTVGFVSKLPHDLVNAFKATLEEVKYADLLLHVIDASNEKYDLQMSTTVKVLKELGVESKNIINVYNKIDKAPNSSDIPKDENTVFISALNGINLQQLIAMIRSEVGTKLIESDLLIPYTKGNVASQLHNDAQVLSSEYQEEGILVRAKMPTLIYEKYKEYVKQ